ncbi:MAG TPA: glycosyltransferase family 4 protein [Candidatus Eisenbergiella stercoravium]|nr:glycosyltransferase family 4 protein [Candidatus Eisenbergiella stercoravium]
MNMILFYANYAAPYEGNFIASQRSLIIRLKEKGFNVLFMLPRSACDLTWVNKLEEEVQVVYLPDKRWQRVNVFRRIFRSYQVIFIHVHFLSGPQNEELKIGMRLAGKQVPVIHHFHNHYTPGKHPAKREMKRYFLRGDYLVGCSLGVAEGLKQAGLKNPIDYVENAIDFGRLPDDRAGNMDKYRGTFLIFGFEYERKGVDLAVEACEKLRKKYPEIKLNICLAANRKYAEKKLKEHLGEIPGWINLLPPTDKIGKYYQKAMAFLSPSKEEGFCYSVVEAAYCGCAVIASRISGQDGIRIAHLRWCRPNDVEDLAYNMEKIIQMSEEEQKELGKCLHREAKENYCLGKWVKEMLLYYQKNGFL